MNAELPRNIQLFNLVALKILADLYERFPRPTELKAGEIAAKLAESEPDAEPSSAVEHVLLIQIAEHSIQWLLDEGYIRQQGGMSRQLSGIRIQAVLSSKGLMLLGRPIQLRDEEPATFYQQAKSLLGTSSQKAVERGLGELMTKGWASIWTLATNSPPW